MPALAPFRPRSLVAIALFTATACASSPKAPSSQEPLPLPKAPATAAQEAAWPVRTREHIDLWLHGYAMLMDDTARVPLFRAGYRDSMRTIRGRANVTTGLDAERDKLRARLAVNPNLALGAQFVALAFPSWQTLRTAVDAFIKAQGNPQQAGDQQTAAAVAFLAASFPTPADREWLRIFAGALDDESTRFYHNYWVTQQQQRNATLAAVETAWNDLRARVARFRTNTQQQGGELVLSLPLGGEGRTTSGGPKNNLVVVGFPPSPAAANEALYAAVHEIVGSTAGAVVSDNVSPAEQRSGEANRYVSAAQVRCGYLLLRKTMPDLATGYARYYLGLVRVPTSGDPAAALAQAFPLPASMADALAKQIDMILSGI